MKKILFILISLLIGVAIILFSLELSLRINPKFGYIYSSFKFKCDKLGMHQETFNYLRPSALLGYEHIPNCNKMINSYGLTGREYKFHKDKDTFRILILGDSIAAQGWSCEFLEGYLNNNPLLQARYKSFEIWDAGVASYDVRRYALYLKYKGVNYKPDMVIIYFCLNDFVINTSVYYKDKNGTTRYYFPIPEISKRYNVNPFLMKRSYLYRFVILRLDSYLLSKKRPNGISQMEENGRYYLQMIKEICENNKIPLFAVIFPYLKPLDKYKDEQIEEYKTIRKVTKDLGIVHLDLYGYLPIENMYVLRENKKEDEIHPNLEEGRFIAKLIYNFLLNNFFNIQHSFLEDSARARM